MQSGYYQVTGAMVSEFNLLDMTSNNLANINTSGFKRDGAVIGNFERILQKARDELPLENGSDKAAKFFNRTINKVPRIVKEYIDFSPGNIKYTGNSLDIALKEGDTFFAVLTPQGVKLTQQSNFSLNQDGEIVTKEGYKLLPSDFMEAESKSIFLPTNSTIKIEDDGSIYANGVNVGKIFVCKVKNLNEVKKIGDNLYDIKDIQKRITPLENGSFVKQGYELLSNVNPVKEMVSLIKINRMVEMYQKVMLSYMNDLNQDAINKLASVKA